MKPVTIDKAKSIEGWMSEAELLWLASRAQPAKVIIEIGSYHGRSTRALADNTEGLVYSVDPYSGAYYTNQDKVLRIIGDETYNQLHKNLADHLCSGRVVHYRGTFENFTPYKNADLIFIDADHRKEAVLNDIRLAIKFIAPNGIIAGHDYNDKSWPGVKEAVDQIFRGFPIQLLESIWYIQT